MSKPFDLEAAKQGSKFYYEGAPTDHFTFIGITSRGRIVGEDLYGFTNNFDRSSLRMCATKRVMYAPVYKNRNHYLGQMYLYESADNEVFDRARKDKVFVAVARVEWEE